MVPVANPDTRERVAGSASATGEHGAAEAVECAIDALGREPGLVLLFTAGGVDPDAVAIEAHAAARGARVAGMTGTGAIGRDGPIESGCSAIAFSSSLPAGVGAVEAGEPRTAGREAAAQALAAIDGAPYELVLLFVDSESGDQAEVVAGAYSVAGGTVLLAGGAAGGPARARFVDDHALSVGVVAVAIGSSKPIGVGVAHGCVPRGAPSIVTRSEGPIVLELDGRPAQTVYFEKLGVDPLRVSDKEFEALAMVHPLAEPELRGLVRPRYVRARTPDGGLVCATSIERNAAVEVCDQSPATIIDSARASVAEAMSPLHGPAHAAVVFDCAARNMWFGEEFTQRELSALLGAFGEPPVSLAGAYTRGEIGRARGAKGDRNHSVVVAAFGAPD